MMQAAENFIAGSLFACSSILHLEDTTDSRLGLGQSRR